MPGQGGFQVSAARDDRRKERVTRPAEPGPVGNLGVHARAPLRVKLAIAVLAAAVGYVIGRANPKLHRGTKADAAATAGDDDPRRSTTAARRSDNPSTTDRDGSQMDRREADLADLDEIDRSWQRIDMLALCADAIHQAGAGDSHRPITLQVGSTDQPTVIGDGAGLRQVLDNLIDNTLRRSPASIPIEVRLSTTRQPGDDTGILRLEVADRGPGMTPAAAARAFEDNPTRPGLPVAAAIVEAHGGQIDIDTQPGHGSCLRVLLPLADQPPARQ